MLGCEIGSNLSLIGYDNALLLVTMTIDKVMTGEIGVQDLVVSKLLRQDIYKYRSLFPHVSAAIRLREAGKSLVRGDNIQYVYTDAQHHFAESHL
jgi:DNA polymerase elongation subunit (family B)